MIDKVRRDALALFGIMAAVSASTAMVRFAPTSNVVAAEIDLDRIFPSEFDAWRIDETSREFVRPTTDQGKQYGIYDQVLERTFVNDMGQRVMLSVAYGSEQSRSLDLHRPELCYRFNGYQVLEPQTATLTLAGQSVQGIDLLAVKPGRPEAITYWIVLGGEPVTHPRASHWRLMSFGLRRQLPDGLLVRVSSIDADPKAAFDLHRRFADSMVRAMSLAHRAQVIGRPEGS